MIRRELADRGAVFEQGAERGVQAAGLLGAGAVYLRQSHDLDEQLLVTRPRPERFLTDAVEEMDQSVRRRARLLAGLFDQRAHVVEERLGDLADDVMLGREVVEERLLRDVGPVADLVDRRRLEALLIEQVARSVEQPIADLLLPALAPARGDLGKGAGLAHGLFLSVSG